MILRSLLAGLMVTAAPALASPNEVRIIGDSIGEGLHLASGAPSPANRYNVAIYTRKALDQLKSAPRGSVVVLSLGTNDAVAGLVEQKDKVAELAAAAAAQGVKLIWVGPPCVRTSWQVHSKALDANLARELQDSSVTYVSAQDEEFCAASMHAGDGVHFTMAGYSRIWQKAATVAGIPVTVASSAEPKAGSSHAHPKTSHHKRKHKARERKEPNAT